MDKLYTKAYVEKADDDIVAVASTDLEDRHGEIVSNDGWQLENFKNAPRLLWAHDHKDLPIGDVQEIWVEKEKDNKGSTLKFKPRFQEVTEKGRAIKELVKQGFLNTFSVGFQALETDHDEDAKSGVKITQQELLEISLVNVPANPEAMTLAYKHLKEQGYDNQTINQSGIPAEIIERQSALEEEVTTLKEKVGEIESKADDAVKGISHLNPHNTGRKRIAQDRQTWLKIIERASNKMLQDGGDERAKIIKKATDNLIQSNKGDIHGKNQRSSEETE